MTSSVHVSPRISRAPAMGQADRSGTRALYRRHLHLTSHNDTVRPVRLHIASDKRKEPLMVPAAHALIAELETEAATTRRVLQRVPDDRLAWQPHAKSMTLGQLAHHIASIPGSITRMAQQDGFDIATRNAEYAACDSTAAALATHDASVAAARTFLSGLSEDAAQAIWRLTF